MAWLESCLCLNLFAASILVGLVVMTIYLVAFAVELWWIIDTYAFGLPIPAYVLCAGYFSVFFVSVIMIAGMIGQKSRCVLVWLFSVVVFFVPEGGLVLYMSIIHWTLRHKYGLTELIFWVCRAILDIVAVIVVQSQYATWRHEKEVLRRLQSIHMSGIINDAMMKEGPLPNGRLPSNSASQHGAYENLGFTSATDIRPMIISDHLMPHSNGRVQRSLSSASQLQVPHHHNSLYGGSLPGNHIKVDPHWPQLQSVRTVSLAYTNSDHSHFETSPFDHRIFAFPVQSNATIDRRPSDLSSYHPRSLMYLDKDDYLTRPPPSRAVSLGYVNIHPAFSTQSLDRAKFLRLNGPRRTTSLDALDMRMRPDVRLQKVAMQPFDYLNRPGSKQSDMDNLSENVPNLSDVAL